LILLAKAEEFAEIRFNPGDKSILHDLAKDCRIRFGNNKREKLKIKDVWQKIFLLIQDVTIRRS